MLNDIKYKILVVDDHPLMRRGIIQLLAFDPELTILADVSDGQSALEVVERHEPDLILLDLNMRPLSGLDTLKLLRERGCTSRIVILTVSNDSSDVVELLRAGADGYLLKDLEPEQLLDAVKDAVNGDKVIDPKLQHLVKQAMIEDGSRQDSAQSLTSREAQVLDLIAEGKPNKVIANQLSISESTVKVHVKNLLRKLNLRSRTEAAVWKLNR